VLAFPCFRFDEFIVKLPQMHPADAPASHRLGGKNRRKKLARGSKSILPPSKSRVESLPSNKGDVKQTRRTSRGSPHSGLAATRNPNAALNRRPQCPWHTKHMAAPTREFSFHTFLLSFGAWGIYKRWLTRILERANYSDLLSLLSSSFALTSLIGSVSE